MDIKKVLCTFIAIVLLLSLVSCGINPAAKYPIIEIKYSEDIISTNPSVEIQTLGYSFGEGNIFEYDNGIESKALATKNSLYTYDSIIDTNNTFYIINMWKDISWDNEPRYDLHLGGYLITLESGQRIDFPKGKIILSVSDGYAYYLEGVEIHKMNLHNEFDNTAVYTFPFKKKLPKNPVVTIDGVEIELDGWYIFTISDQNILVQGQSYTGGETIYYDFADIKT